MKKNIKNIIAKLLRAIYTFPHKLNQALEKKVKALKREKFERIVGRPNYNLTILPKPRKLILDIESIEAWASAIQFAKEHILGERHVTMKGFILPLHVEHLPCREATFSLAENKGGIISVKLLQENGLGKLFEGPRLILQYSDSENGLIGLFQGYPFLIEEMDIYLKGKTRETLSLK